MRIKLHNFRCYKDREFNLPDTGLILLSGASGSGKSTLLKAILYALYGSKAIKRPYLFGTKTCSVQLDFHNLHIYRSSSPNRLVVNEKYEDEVAQQIINKRLAMDYPEFLISSFIQQKKNNSILSVAPMEQVKILKTLCFDGEINEKYKTRIKAMISTSNEALIKKRTEVEFLEGEIEKKSKDLHPIKFPLSAGNEERIIAKFKRRFSETPNRLVELRNKEREIVEQINKINSLKKQVELIIATREQINIRLNETQEIHDSINIPDIPQDIEKKIENIKEAIKYRKIETEIEELNKCLANMRKDNLEEAKKEYEIISEKIWPNLSKKQTTKKIEDFRTRLVTTSEFENLCKKYSLSGSPNELKSIYSEKHSKIAEKYKKALEEKHLYEISQNILKCPSCKADLYIEKSQLNLYINKKPKNLSNNLEEINMLKKEEAKISAILAKLDSINDIMSEKDKKNMDKLEIYLNINNHMEQELQKLEAKIKSGEESKAERRIRQKIEQKQKELESIKNIEKNIPLKSLKIKLRKLEDNQENYNKYKNEMKNIKIKISKLKNEIQKISDEIEEKNSQISQEEAIETLKERSEALKISIIKAEEKYEKDKELNERLEEYLFYKKEKEELDKTKMTLYRAKLDMEELEKRHTANLTLKTRLYEAEILALNMTINNINDYTSQYLSLFFGEEIPTIFLEAQYKGKLKTLKINLVINYKGNIYDNIDQFSGGELDRCTLASVCGINALMNSPILILDESLSSLDATTNTDIIKKLAGLAENKLILVCSHEAVQGIFTEIIEI